MKTLSKKHILLLHQALIEATGGSDGVRDTDLLDAALHAPFQAFGGVEAFPSLQQKAARLGFGLIQNHAFVDGNKRIGAHAMLTFLSLNGIELNYTQKELYTMVLEVASGKLAFEGMVNWILEHQE